MFYIFDFDGTIANSVDKIVTALQAAIQAENLPAPSYFEMTQIIGLGLVKAIETLLPQIDRAQAERVAKQYSDNVVNSNASLVLYEGVEETLKALVAAGHTLAIATGKSTKGLARVLAGSSIESCFTYTRCADETRSKPDPLMLHELLEESGFSAEQAVMVGDTTFDMEMAVAAKIKAIGISYGVHSVDKLVDAGAGQVLDRFDQLLTINV